MRSARHPHLQLLSHFAFFPVIIDSLDCYAARDAGFGSL
jgi:hypothetical protein